jgi:hypothetical protein
MVVPAMLVRPKPATAFARWLRASAVIGLLPVLGFAVAWIPGLLSPNWMEPLAWCTLLASIGWLLAGGDADQGHSTPVPSRLGAAVTHLLFSLSIGGLAALIVVEQAGRMTTAAILAVLAVIGLSGASKFAAWGMNQRPPGRNRRLSLLLTLILPAGLLLAALLSGEFVTTLLALAWALAFAGISWSL